jgi:segregation and condensation protein A
VPDREKEFRGEPVFELNLYEVMKAFREVMNEFEATSVSEIEPEVFTIEEKIDLILSEIESRGQMTFQELFSGSRNRLEVVVTFIALLELIKRTRIKARQEKAFGEIWIYKSDEPGPEESPETQTRTDAEKVEGA